VTRSDLVLVALGAIIGLLFGAIIGLLFGIAELLRDILAALR
jgi:ABC-type nitrate/sulfonate/bicarbonate transport system permease component